MTKQQVSIMKKFHKIAPTIALLIAMLFWGNSFIAIKIALQSYSPIFIMTIRMALALLLLAPFFPKLIKQFQKKDLKLLIIMGLCEPCLYFLFESTAMTETSASQAGVICALLPVIVALFSLVIYKTKIPKKVLISYSLALIGAIWLSTASVTTHSAPNPLKGNLLQFCAMIWAALYTLSVKKLSDHYSPLFLTAFQTLIGTLFFSTILLVSPGNIPTKLYLEPTIALLFLGSCVTIFAYFGYNYGVGETSPLTAVVFINLIPIIALISSWIVLNEKITVAQLCASGLIIAALIVAESLEVMQMPKIKEAAQDDTA